MAWKIELDRAAVRELGKLDQQTARRILAFLHSRVAPLDDPRSIGEALKGSKLVKVLEVPDRRLPRHRPHRGRRFACARGEGRKP